MNARWKQLARKVTGDKKKLSMIVLLSVALLLLWGRLLLKQVPRTALAEPESPATESDAGASAAPGVGAPLRQTVYLDLPRALDRDLFHLDPGRYRRMGTTQEPDGGAKSATESVDNDGEMEAIRRWVRGLELQAAILGDEPTAMIDDQLYRVGDRVNGFAVTTIGARYVTLSKGEIEIRLEMGE